MLRTTFGKTLFEKRWVILGWTLALFATNLLLLQIFPPMKDAFSSMMADLPDSLAVWFGSNGEIWSSLKGFIGLEVMGQMALIVIVFAITFTSSTFAKEESDGRLLSQLARPRRRASYFIQKFLAIIFASAIVMAGFLFGTFVGSVVLGDAISIETLFLPCVAVWLLALVFASLMFSLSAMFGRKALAGVVVGFYALIGYFVSSLRGGADILETLAKMTPFYYYNNPSVMDYGFQTDNLIVIACLIIIPLIISLPIFCRRDLRTR
ncbi:ABC transporter permease [Candidatus Saccharibacteria bacterium]|nr:ABC transporter permease [Candidatus Saccharibacteria bacterium]MCL1963291.1 ABC transporter permease [Candidatus Saccharibacteria bacterium]